MDLSYQDSGHLQAFGLIFQLLRQGVPVDWTIGEQKTWHAAPCDTPGDECAWDCDTVGSGVKCAYPTASPDFEAMTEVVWDDAGTRAAGTPIYHAYRGGPFVIDSAYRDRALQIIDAWNDQSLWAANPFAQRTVFQVVSVHEATASFTANASKRMVAAPTIAVFSDGNEDIATGYLRAAGIPQSSGAEFPAGKCGNNDCGPGTTNPDMLTVPSIMGDMGTCDNLNYDHKNGALFTTDGLPAFCQIMSMHWGVNDREKVECDGGACPAEQGQCAGETITYHGHEVVAEVRQFLGYPTHFFAECQAVNAYENTVPNPAWPYLDDPERRGHFLTTEGSPPACPCTDGDFECVTGGCNGADCCLPKNNKESGAGFLIAPQPNSNTIQILHASVPYMQLDGRFDTTGGSEPAYNLSSYLMTEYINDRDVTFITGPNGPGEEDVWMTGYLDGECDIIDPIDFTNHEVECNGGKVSYLGGHSYDTSVPLSGSAGSQGARLFLNALFEADCVTSVGQPDFQLSLRSLSIAANQLPVEADMTATFFNDGAGFALDAVLEQTAPAGVEIVSVASGGNAAGAVASWNIGAISGAPARAGDPAESGNLLSRLRFDAHGDYPVELRITYRVGQSTLERTNNFIVTVGLDSDGDGVLDDDDLFPADPNRCGDSDDDGCDDCSSGTFDPANDGVDEDGDGICEGSGGDGGCGCQTGRGGTTGAVIMGLLALLFVRRRWA